MINNARGTKLIPAQQTFENAKIMEQNIKKIQGLPEN